MRSASRSPAFKRADAAVELDALHVEAVRRQPERAQQAGRAPALEGKVVDREHARQMRAPGISEGRGAETGLPVVRMHEVGPPGRDGAPGDGGAGLAKGGEALRVVGPVGAGRVVV